MRKLFLPVLLVGLVLAGCASQRPEDQAIDLCLKSASEQLGGVSLNRDGLEATNFGEALYDAGITETKNSDTSNAMFTVTGKVTWVDGSTTNRKSMLCTVKFENGKPDVNATLT